MNVPPSEAPQDGEAEQHTDRMSRRRFVRYAGGAVVGAAAVYGGRYLIPPTTSFDCRTTNRTLEFIAPRSGEMIEFINRTEEPAFLPTVNYSWSVDHKVTSSSRNYSCSLTETPTGQSHAIQLTGSRGFMGFTFQRQLEVNPDSLPQYPPRSLRVPVKGISYVVGMKSYNMPPVKDSDLAEALTVIREVGCNAIRIVGDYVESLIGCAELCSNRFDTIVLSPICEGGTDRLGMDVEEVMERNAREVASGAETVRRNSSSKVRLSIGNELATEMKGIVPGDSIDEREAYVSKNGGKLSPSQKTALENALRSLSSEARKHFSGELTYESGCGEGPQINWSTIDVDVLSPHVYFYQDQTAEDYLERINQFLRLAQGKPVFIGEFGFVTIEDTVKWGVSGWDKITNDPSVRYSQEDQAYALNDNLELINETNVDGIFLWDFVEPWDKDLRWSPGIVEYNGPGTLCSRKLSFYEYQSWRI